MGKKNKFNKSRRRRFFSLGIIIWTIFFLYLAFSEIMVRSNSSPFFLYPILFLLSSFDETEVFSIANQSTEFFITVILIFFYSYFLAILISYVYSKIVSLVGGK